MADYLIERMFREDNRVIYTAPIKALSNQKYKEFKRLLGRERRHRHWGRGYQQWAQILSDDHRDFPQHAASGALRRSRACRT